MGAACIGWSSARKIVFSFQVGTIREAAERQRVRQGKLDMLTGSWQYLLHLQEILSLFRLSFNRELAGTVVVRRVLLSSESSLALSVDDVPLPVLFEGCRYPFQAVPNPFRGCEGGMTMTDSRTGAGEKNVGEVWCEDV